MSLKIFLLVGSFFVNSLIAAIISYITQLHGRIKTSNVENIKMLDAMHEGLLILSKSPDNRMMFCNKPAQKLLMKTIEYHEIK